MSNRKITQEEIIKNALGKAFDAGENWGVTYSGWFSPTQDETDDKKRELYDAILPSILYDRLNKKKLK